MLIISSISYAQNADSISGKTVLDHSVYETWKRLEKQKISDNGNYISFEINPQKGDGMLFIFNEKLNKKDSVSRGYDLIFSPNEDFALFKIKPSLDSLRRAKLLKKKPEEMPRDIFGIKIFKSLDKKFALDSVIQIVNFKNYAVPEENNSIIVFTTEPTKEDKDEAKKDGNEKIITTSNLTVFNPVTNTVLFEEKDVNEYTITKSGEKIGYIKLTSNEARNLNSEVYIYNIKKKKAYIIFKSKGKTSNLAIDDDGLQTAFLYAKDTSGIKKYSLYYSSNPFQRATRIADSNTYFLPDNWEISENAKLDFSDDGSKLYFGTAPKVYDIPKDSLPEDEIFKVDIWNWNDIRLQSQQLFELEKDKKKTYRAVYRTDEKAFYQLEDSLIEKIDFIKGGNADFALGTVTKPYLKTLSWKNPIFNDFYLINLKTGEKKLIVEKIHYDAEISPGANYILYYDEKDSSINSYSIAEDKHYKLNISLPVSFCEEDYDVPNAVPPYGFAGWTEDDRNVLIYDKYDIWKFHPLNKIQPVNLTKNGRENKTIYRYAKLFKDSIIIRSNEDILLSFRNEINFKEGFKKININDNSEPYTLIEMDNSFTKPVKAKNSDKILWTKSSYTEFPDLWISNVNFENPKKHTHTNPQQESYFWGQIEPFYWKDSAGTDMKGLLLKPENFNPEKKYPMIVYFYEKYTDKFHMHYIPNPSRSVINFPLYNSNGYIIFIPDITYKLGYPGESAYNAIMSGTHALVDKGFIDEKNIGLQGQSWGGYQVAYLVGRTNYFKAAMSGAPVANMTSAYGQIRGESGLVRAFQYEQTQSRIGGTLWEKFDLYIKNSPLFYVDKIETPLLIMSNDADGAVPHQQGLEYFNALRRLDKKAWLLNYNGDAHNLRKWPNRVDLSIRMKQFFDHYLKGEPMPEWMEKGIPAVEKGIKKGY
ncbi:MAG: S9 family peptidase [Ignavibacteria bacterium]|nr:S9 family peptidase [Ignavibacteria bacterium]